MATVIISHFLSSSRFSVETPTPDPYLMPPYGRNISWPLTLFIRRWLLVMLGFEALSLENLR
jgi:hypothetical protein